MLSAEDIQDLVNGGEGYNVDFKRSVPSKVRELTEEVCSFLNAAGGYLLIGVKTTTRLSVQRLITANGQLYKAR